MSINPAKFQSILQQATDQQLVQMLRRPDEIPSMFIQQEIARRRKMRQASQADMSKMMPARIPNQMYKQPNQVAQQPRMMHDGGPAGHMHKPHQPYIPINLFPTTLAGQKIQDYYKYRDEPDFVPYNKATDIFGGAANVVGQIMEFPGKAVSYPFEKIASAFEPSDEYLASQEKKQAQQSAQSSNAMEGFGEGQGSVGIQTLSGAGDEKFTTSGKHPMADIFNDAKDPNNKTSGSFLSSLTNVPVDGGRNTLGDWSINYNKSLDNNLAKLQGLMDNTAKLYEKGITDSNAFISKSISALEGQKDDLAQLASTDELEDLQSRNVDHLNSMVEFIKNDQTIVDAQKKLMDAMKPHGTPTQRFFGYVADFGARLAGSDADNISQAAGQALEQTLSDFKFDRKEDQNMFIEKSKLFLEFEQQRKDNELKAMEFKARIYGTEIDDEYRKLETKRDILSRTSQIDQGIMNLGLAGQQNMTSLMASLNQNQAQAINTTMQIEGLKQDGFIKQAEFAEKQLNNDRNFMINQQNQLTKEMKNYMFEQDLGEDERGAFRKYFQTAKQNNITPDVTARTMWEKITKDIKEGGGEPEVAKAILGDKLYNMIKMPNGNIDQNKLLGILYNNVLAIQMSGGTVTGGTGADFTYSGGTLTKNQ
jgi:hypothetical protein